MKEWLMRILKYYYYVTRVVWVPIRVHLKYPERQITGGYIGRYPVRLWSVIKEEEKRDERKQAFQESQMNWAQSFGSGRPTTAGELSIAYIIGFGLVMYFILFKIVLPVLVAMFK